MKKKIVIILLLIIVLSGCSIHENYLVRHDIETSEVQYLYMNMGIKEIYETFGLPHRTYKGIYEILDYNNGNIVLRMELKNNKLYRATLFEGENTTDIILNNDKEIESDKNNKMKVYNKIDEDSLDFITNETSSKYLQENIGAPYKFKSYILSDGIEINSFLYKLNNGNTLYILYTYKGNVGGAFIKNIRGDITKELVMIE